MESAWSVPAISEAYARSKDGCYLLTAFKAFPTDTNCLGQHEEMTLGAKKFHPSTGIKQSLKKDSFMRQSIGLTHGYCGPSKYIEGPQPRRFLRFIRH